MPAETYLRNIFCTQLIIDLICLMISAASILFLTNEPSGLMVVIPSAVYFLIACAIDFKCIIDLSSDSTERRAGGWYCFGMGLASVTDVVLAVGFIISSGLYLILYVFINLLADGSGELFNRIALAVVFTLIVGLNVLLALTCINQLILIWKGGHDARAEVQSGVDKTYK